MDSDLRERLERFIEHHLAHGTALPVDALCSDRPELAGRLAPLVARYLAASQALDPGASPTAGAPGDLPVFDGFRTIERIGSGGMGDVYKLQDLTLGRIVAAKVLKAGAEAARGLAQMIAEARSLALFSDPRFVRVLEFRPDPPPPVIIMEHVDGFELGRLGPSLEFRQRARAMRDVCEAIHHAHGLGLFHRDLKPSNIMLDAHLAPKILDLGLSARDRSAGHFRGTPHYLAPEQLDPTQPLDARTDVYALGVILYELLCGTRPYDGGDEAEVLEQARRGTPRLPVEIDPAVPEPLQAVALKAMELSPADRYGSAREMALDLDRYLEGRPVLARPSLYASALGVRIRPHLEQVDEWQRLQLIYPHEAAALRSAYRQLEAREEEWIVASRALSFSQIALYLGAFLVMCGSLFYFGAHRFYEAVKGLARPFAVLGLPFAGLHLAGLHLYRRDHKAVAVAFFLGGVSLLPLFLLIFFHETGLWVVPAATPGQFFSDGAVSNRQLQVTVLVACAWSAWLALRTRTVALSTVFTLLVLLLVLALLTDAGLRGWLDDGRYDRLALHLLPLAALYAVGGQLAERRPWPWLSRPMYVGAVVVLVLGLELLALDGRAFQYLHVSMRRFQPSEVSNPLLLDTLTAMTLNGLAFYGAGLLVNRFGSDLKAFAAWLLFTVSPFAVLEPFAWLVETGEYAHAFDWIYLALALGTVFVSHQRQRRSFYYAGVINTGVALWFVADHHEWFDKPLWAITLIAVGLGALAAGFALASRERRLSRPGSSEGWPGARPRGR